jgi:CRP-like cAMP-binding protein
LKTVTKIAKEEAYDSGAIIFHENDHADKLYILETGKIELFFKVEVEYHPELYKELQFSIVNPGELFGISALIEPHLLTSTARAAKPSQVIAIDASKLLNQCDRDEKLAYGLTFQIAKTSMERLKATRLQLANAWSMMWS